MHNPHTPHARRNTSSRGCQQRGYTLHVRIGGSPFPQARRSGTTTYRVTWWVAGKRCGRNFHNKVWAETFRQKLVHAARRGEPFDATSGFPLSFATNKPRRATRRRSPGAHHE
jgi:hypothetical protein